MKRQIVMLLSRHLLPELKIQWNYWTMSLLLCVLLCLSFQLTKLKPEHIQCQFSHSTPVFIDLLFRYAVGVTMEKKTPQAYKAHGVDLSVKVKARAWMSFWLIKPDSHQKIRETSVLRNKCCFCPTVPLGAE